MTGLEVGLSIAVPVAAILGTWGGAILKRGQEEGEQKGVVLTKLDTLIDGQLGIKENIRGHSMRIGALETKVSGIEGERRIEGLHVHRRADDAE